MHDTRPAPGTVIGYLKSGRPVRLQAGGSETATEAPPAPAAPPAAPPAPAPQAPAPAAPRVPPGQPDGGQFAPQQPPAAPAQPAAPPTPQAPPEPDWKAQAETHRAEAERLKAEAERWKAQSRQQEARSKANHAELRNRDALLRQVAEKVGVEFDDKPDPEELTRKLDLAQLVARQRSIELAVYTTAASAGGNALAILDSREFMDKTAQLDPDAADFSSSVAELVREAATQPRYQFQQPPQPAQAQPPAPVQQPPAQPQAPAQPAPPQPPASSSGADFSGAPGGNRLWTQADYDHWTKPGMDRDGKIMAKAIEDGLLVNLGIGKPRNRSRR